MSLVSTIAGLMVFSIASCFPVAEAQLRPDGATTISVSGEATVNVVPDKVQITLGIESSEATVHAAKDANDVAAASVLEVTRQFHVDPKDVKTDHISIEPSYEELNSSRRSLHPTHYLVRKSIVVTLHETARFDAFLSAAVEGGANVVLDVQFLTTDLRRYRDQARVMAMKAAKEKADLLAGAVGQKAGKALNINEASVNFWPGSDYGRGWGRSNNGMSQNYLSNEGAGGAAGETTAPGQASIRVTVSATFLLE